MGRFIRVSGLVVLSAASALVAAGCGGGGPCGEYCEASLSCVEADGCDISDRDKAKNECASACEAGLDNVEDSEVRSAVNDCLHCLAPLYADSCQLTDQEALKCQEACLPAQSGLQDWSVGFSEAIEDTSVSCSN